MTSRVIRVLSDAKTLLETMPSDERKTFVDVLLHGYCHHCLDKLSMRKDGKGFEFCYCACDD